MTSVAAAWLCPAADAAESEVDESRLNHVSIGLTPTTDINTVSARRLDRISRAISLSSTTRLKGGGGSCHPHRCRGLGQAADGEVQQGPPGTSEVRRVGGSCSREFLQISSTPIDLLAGAWHPHVPVGPEGGGSAARSSNRSAYKPRKLEIVQYQIGVYTGGQGSPPASEGSRRGRSGCQGLQSDRPQPPRVASDINHVKQQVI